MVENSQIKLKTVAIIGSLVVIAAGSLVIWTKYQPAHPLEISLSQTPQQLGEIYIGGKVNKPGYYPFLENDSVSSLLQAAGGTQTGANMSEVELYVGDNTSQNQPQKININTAEVWLLQALPGIGETLAQRIVDYRTRNGFFKSIDELLKVPGIGAGVYDKIKNLITVAGF